MTKQMTGVTQTSAVPGSSKVRCPNCAVVNLRNNLKRHQKTDKCKFKNQFDFKVTIVNSHEFGLMCTGPVRRLERNE